ncbi:MAG TPA: hypothetical protein VHC20_02365 [Candidatus Paceibacterota bacterium]|nr:hypothetical protein [Candidatus Paceibacterota bacterium]
MPPARTVRQQGSITLEIIIAFAVASLVLTSVILLVGGSDALAYERSIAERSLAYESIQDARIAWSSDIASMASYASTTERDHVPYSLALIVSAVTPCLTELSAAASSTGGVGDGIELRADLADTALARALGDDCEYHAASDWSHPRETGTAPIDATAVDVLGGTVYLGRSMPPYLAVGAGDASLPFQNGFALSAPPNAIDAALVGGTPYVFAALASSTGQFVAVDMRDPSHPIIAAQLSLAGINPAGSDPAAYHVLYYDGRAYVVTRYIAGAQPELHIFDVADPAHAYEMGNANLETTVRGMTARTRVVHGVAHTFFYAATTYDTRELAVYDVTDPAHVSLVSSVDLPGTQDGDSIAAEGNMLYLGRASNTAGPELYAFEVHDPAQAPVLVATAEITSKDITAIIPVGSLLFVAATNDGASNRMLQIWDMSDTAHVYQRAALKIPGLVLGGIEYASSTLYAIDATTFHSYED